MRKALACGLVIMLFSAAAFAHRRSVSDLPSSRNGVDTADSCLFTATPYVCKASTVSIPGMQAGNSFAVKIDVYQWGQGNPDAVGVGDLGQKTTILEVSLSSPTLHLLSLQIKGEQLSQPGLLICSWDFNFVPWGTSHCIDSPLAQDVHDSSILFALQPQPVADDVNHTVSWSFVNFNQSSTRSLGGNSAALSLEDSTRQDFIPIPTDTADYRAMVYDDSGNLYMAGALAGPAANRAANDLVAQAMAVTSNPFAGSETIAQSATVNATPTEDLSNPGAAESSPDGVPDPVPADCCGGGTPFVSFRSVWYTFTPPFGGTMDVDTLGTNYDTILAVYTKDGSGRFVELACNDDVGVACTGDTDPLGHVQSAASIPVTAGTNYYILVSEGVPLVGVEVDDTGNIVVDSNNNPVAVVTPLSSDANLSLQLSSTDFSIAPGDSQTLTVAAGQSATFNLTLNSILGYAGDVTLSCSGQLPKGVGCNPASTMLTGSSVPVSLTVTTTSRTLSASLTGGAGGFLVAACCLNLAFLRRRLFTKLLLIVVVCGLSCSCGGGSGNGGGNGGGVNPNGTPIGNYDITVVAASSGQTHAATVKLIVQ